MADKLTQAMERAGVFIARQAISVARASPSKFVFIPCHWCFDGFTWPEQGRSDRSAWNVSVRIPAQRAERRPSFV